MSKKATEFQRKAMSRMYRGKEIFKPLNTGWIDENVACVREWVANIFFYRKGDTTIMIDAGYNYDRLAEKMNWLGICVLMKELGLYDLTPALCHLDYTMSEAGAATNFVRQYTLASGGPYCDCGYKKKGFVKAGTEAGR